MEYHENRLRYLRHYYETNCKASGQDAFKKKIQLVQVQNGRQSAIILFHMAVIW